MANDTIISDVGAVFHRLFDHRAAMHSEHQFFVKEFEGRRGNQDMQKLQSCMGMMNEIDALFLPEIFTSKQYFRSIREQVNEIGSMGDAIMKKETKYTSTKGLSKSEQAKLDQGMQEYKTSLLKQKEKYMEAHKDKMSSLTQELEALQLQLQALGPQKLRGSTASLTTSSVAEDMAENVSESSETEENPSQHQEEKDTKDTDPNITQEENETKDTEPEVMQNQEEEMKDTQPEVMQNQEEMKDTQEEETKDTEPEVTDELTT